MKALVTGGAGFIGSYIVEQLLRQGVNTIVYDNLTTGNLANLASFQSDVQFIQADVRNLDALVEAANGVEWVFHLAALTSVAQSVAEPLLTNEMNISGTLNTLWAALKNHSSRVVIASSCSVYGDIHQPPLKESDLPQPKSPYAASKLTAEVLAESFYHSYGLETVCLRFFNVYGLRQQANSDYAAAIPRFVRRYQQKQPPQIYGDGRQSRDFIHVRDVAKANLSAATLPSEALVNHRVFNVGTGVSTSILDLVQAIADVAGYYLEPEHHPARSGEVRDSCADCTLAQTVLKFHPEIRLATGIKSLYG